MVKVYTHVYTNVFIFENNQCTRKLMQFLLILNFSYLYILIFTTQVHTHMIHDTQTKQQSIPSVRVKEIQAFILYTIYQNPTNHYLHFKISIIKQYPSSSPSTQPTQTIHWMSTATVVRYDRHTISTTISTSLYSISIPIVHFIRHCIGTARICI